MPFVPRIECWLPRDGIGYCGGLPSALSLFTAFRWESDIALPTCLGMASLSVWCAFGLRRDGEEGEVIDVVVTENEQTITEQLLGDVRYSEWRISTVIWLCGIAGLIVALAKWLWIR